MLLFLVLAGAAAVHAEVIADFEDEVELRPYETVRYRIDIDYGTGRNADVDVFVRGLWTPPRVRVLDSRKKEVEDVADTSGDWNLDFDFLAHDGHDHYYVEIDSKWGGDSSKFEVFLTVNADALNNASAEVSVSKYKYDYDNSDHHDCAVSTRAGMWGLLPLGALALLAVRRRKVAA